jgi:hypothetical protein
MDKNFKPVYVRGTETGKGVIKALEAYGGKNNCGYTGKDDAVIYYILPNGYIAAVSTNSTQSNYIMATAEEVKPFRWRAEPGSPYYIVCTTMDVMKLYDIRESSDNKLHANGNYFRTREEAEEMAKKIKKILNK